MEATLKKIDGFIQEGKKNVYEFSFNTSQLSTEKVWVDNFFKKVIGKLNDKRGHCLYWFSVDNEKTGNMLKGLSDSQRDALKSKGRTVPAKNTNVDSSIVYVGVRKGGFRQYTIKNHKRVPAPLSNIAGRVIQYLGYYDVGTTQGLQLNYWAKKSKIDVVLNVIEYPDLSDEFLYIIEKLYAIEFSPVLGKH